MHLTFFRQSFKYIIYLIGAFGNNLFGIWSSLPRLYEAPDGDGDGSSSSSIPRRRRLARAGMKLSRRCLPRCIRAPSCCTVIGFGPERFQVSESGFVALCILILGGERVDPV